MESDAADDRHPGRTEAIVQRTHHSRITIGAFGALALAAALAGCASASSAAPATHEPAANAAPHWSYDTAAGPGGWADIDASFAQCGIGHQQSPIDLPAEPPAAAAPSEAAPAAPAAPAIVIVIEAEPTTGTVVDTGHTIQIGAQSETSDASSVSYAGVDYDLLQVHSHSPSEHTINGVAAAAEVHFVHQSDDGELLVVGVLLQEGSESSAWAPYLRAAAGPEGGSLAIDVASLLPAQLDHYAYRGSLTTPPCTEDVQWIVLSNGVELSAAQLDSLRTEYDHNSRPTQPLGDRTISGGTGRVVSQND